MCARPNDMSVRTAAFATALGTAVVALLLFGVLHAVLLVPIWGSLPGGLPFTAVGAVALAWAFAELVLARVLPPRPSAAGLIVGIGAWLVLLPATGLSSVLRVTGLHQAQPALAACLEFGATVLSGACVGLALRRGWRVTASLSTAAGALLAVQAGPVPIVNNPRAMWLFVLLAGVFAVCGACQAVLTARLAGAAWTRAGRATT